MSRFQKDNKLILKKEQLLNYPVNDIGVLGGTFIENTTPNTPNLEEFKIMVDNANKFYGI